MVGKTTSRGWKIKPFSRSDEQDSDMTAIRAGDFCRLFHRQEEGFIRATYKDLALRKAANPEKPAIIEIFDNFLPSA